jgi:hypothetical protein
MNDRRSRLDDAIDRAVRDIVQHDPRPGLRRRVLGRMHPPRRRAALVTQLAFAGGALVLLVAAAVVLRPAPDQPPPPVTQSAASVAREAVPPAPPATPAPTLVTPPQKQPAARITRTSPPATQGRQGLSIPQGRVAATALPDDPAVSAASQLVRIELTIADQQGADEPVRKTLAMVVADGAQGSIRNASGPRGPITVDARPVVTGDSIRLTVKVNYELRDGAGRQRLGALLNQQVTVVLAPGRPLTVSQAADPGSNRRIGVEVTATIVR